MDFSKTPLLRFQSIKEDVMPQLLLPIFPAGVTRITDELAFKKEDGIV